MCDALRYFHGGRPNMKRGQMILPPSVTGFRAAADCLPGQVDASHVRRDRVFVTSAADAAAVFAALYPSIRRPGCVYQVEPLGPLEPDPDCLEPGHSWQCQRARIIRVHPLSPAQAMNIRAYLNNAS